MAATGRDSIVASPQCDGVGWCTTFTRHDNSHRVLITRKSGCEIRIVRPRDGGSWQQLPLIITSWWGHDDATMRPRWGHDEAMMRPWWGHDDAKTGPSRWILAPLGSWGQLPCWEGAPSLTSSDSYRCLRRSATATATTATTTGGGGAGGEGRWVSVVVVAPVVVIVVASETRERRLCCRFVPLGAPLPPAAPRGSAARRKFRIWLGLDARRPSPLHSRIEIKLK